jgi:BT1 family
MYSILMASINLGGVISQSFGAWLTTYLGVTNDKFDNLWILILVTNFASQLPMPFIGAVSEEDVAKCQRKMENREEEQHLPTQDEQQRLQKYE